MNQTLAQVAVTKALKRLQSAQEALEQAALDLIREEVALISLRYPSRFVSYVAGNGARGLEITRRKPLRHGTWSERKRFNFQSWGLDPATRRAAAIMPKFFAALDKLEDESGMSWLGADCFTYQDGREVFYPS